MTLPNIAVVSLVLAADALPWIVGIAIVSVVALVLIIVAPWRTVRREAPLADEIESRLLLGEDPDEIDRDLASREPSGAPVTDLPSADSGHDTAVDAAD